MARGLKILFAWVLSSYAWAPFSAGIGAAVSLLLHNVGGLTGLWQAGFVVSMFVAFTAGVSLPARGGWAYAQQHGPLARALGRKLDQLAACRSVETELLTIQVTVTNAVLSDKWWDPNVETLPSDQWTKHHADVLALDQESRRRCYDRCQQVYVEADGANKLNKKNWETPLEKVHKVALQRLQTRVTEAVTELRQAINS